jgi:hypothetical protein
VSRCGSRALPLARDYVLLRSDIVTRLKTSVMARCNENARKIGGVRSRIVAWAVSLLVLPLGVSAQDAFEVASADLVIECAMRAAGKPPLQLVVRTS